MYPTVCKSKVNKAIQKLYGNWSESNIVLSALKREIRQDPFCI